MRAPAPWLAAHGATLGAGLAAIAAIATAIISSNSNAADTQRRTDYEVATAHRDAVGAARVLAHELATVEVYLEGILRVDRLLPYDEKYNIQLGQNDQKRIASEPKIGVDRWQRVSAALTNPDTLESYIRDK